MNEEHLKKLEHLCNEATPGPWYKCHHDICTKTSNGDYRTCDEKECEGNLVILESPDNMKFILAAREAVPALIAEVRTMKKMLRWFANYCSDLEGHNPDDWIVNAEYEVTKND